MANPNDMDLPLSLYLRPRVPYARLSLSYLDLVSFGMLTWDFLIDCFVFRDKLREEWLRRRWRTDTPN